MKYYYFKNFTFVTSNCVACIKVNLARARNIWWKTLVQCLKLFLMNIYHLFRLPVEKRSKYYYKFYLKKTFSCIEDGRQAKCETMNEWAIKFSLLHGIRISHLLEFQMKCISDEFPPVDCFFHFTLLISWIFLWLMKRKLIGQTRSTLTHNIRYRNFWL